MANRKKELQKIINDARRELDGIEAIEARDKYAPLLGKCFKYRNSGGGGDKPWWLYFKALRQEGKGFYGVYFQKTSTGLIEVELDHYCGWIGDGSWAEMPQNEFQVAWDAIRNEINGVSV